MRFEVPNIFEYDDAYFQSSVMHSCTPSWYHKTFALRKSVCDPFLWRGPRSAPSRRTSSPLLHARTATEGVLVEIETADQPTATLTADTEPVVRRKRGLPFITVYGKVQILAPCDKDGPRQAAKKSTVRGFDRAECIVM